MSYSRWINSYWYTFYQATDSKKAEEQFLCIDCEIYFSFKHLKENIDECLEIVKERLEKEAKRRILPSEEQYTELKEYMQQFIRDVEQDKELLFESK